MKIEKIELCSQEINGLKNFYGNILGFKTRELSNGISVKAGSSALTFVESSASEKSFYHFAFDIPENQFYDAKKFISERIDLIFLDGEDEFDFTAWKAHSFYFFDPSGNIVEVIARHNLDNFSPQKFSADSITNINEIGMPVNEPG